MSQAAGKREAQQRADRIRAFREELAELERERVLTLEDSQRHALDEYLKRTLEGLSGRYDIDSTESQKQFSWGMRIASTLAGLALCAAVVLFFLRYWGYLSIPAQVGVLAGTTLVLMAATDFAARREQALYYASLLSIVTFAAFVLNLNALGSIFNVTPTTNALLAWGIFGILLAYLYRLLVPLTAGLVSVLCWVASNFAQWWGGPPLEFLQRPENFLLGGALLLSVPLWRWQRGYAEFDWVYRVIGLVTLFLAVLILSESGSLSYLPLQGPTVERIYQVAGFVAAGLAIWMGVRGRWPHATNVSSGFFTIFLYLRLYHWWWNWMPGYLFFLILGMFSIGLLVVFRRLRARMVEEVAL